MNCRKEKVLLTNTLKYMSVNKVVSNKKIQDET